MFRRTLLIALALLLALSMAEVADLGLARKRTATVKKTFVSQGAISIPDFTVAAPYPSTITVNGFKRAKIIDVNVILSQYSHGTAADVDMVLVAPSGRNALFLSDTGGEAAAVTLQIDDSAPLELPYQENLSSGSFEPSNFSASAGGDDTDDFPNLGFVPSDQPSLRIFNGDNPNGEWKLYVRDDDEFQDGYLDRWRWRSRR